MANLKIFGSVRSRASRVMWTANEAGVPYEMVGVDAAAKDGEYRRVNPNGRFPAIQDGELVLFESMAINLYLAKTYASGSLYPADAADEARVLQWTFWAVNEIEPHFTTAWVERVFRPEGQRDLEKADKAEAASRTPLKVLDQALEGRDYLLGDHFTIADLNVAAAAEPALMAGIDLSAHANVDAWLKRCLARPGHNLG